MGCAILVILILSPKLQDVVGSSQIEKVHLEDWSCPLERKRTKLLKVEKMPKYWQRCLPCDWRLSK